MGSDKYDIFISYSRKDFNEVNEFVEMLRRRIPTLTIWFDITGIESGDEFEDKIISAIDNSSYVLFALSDNSIESQWTKDEVMYAKNIGRRVIPVLLKGAQLKGWFLFKFGRIDCINSTELLQVEKLINNLKQWINKKPEIKEHPIQDKSIQASNVINGHEYVDLGLSVKWATCNVGANRPEEYGDYYAWGETKTKSVYTEENCKTYERKLGDIAGNPQYDAARANWGGSWRLPTQAEIKELIANCTTVWTTQNGVKGRKVTSKKNGKSIFLPAAGWRNGSSLIGAGEYGDYWSSTPDESGTQYSGTQYAYSLYFLVGDFSWGWSSRDDGHSVRPVSE